MGYIYIIKNTVNDKVYIGKTIQTLERRFQKHLSDSKKLNTHFARAMGYKSASSIGDVCNGREPMARGYY